MQVYPNPNDGNMMLDYSLNSTDKGEIMIYDIAGRLIYKYELDASANQLIIINKITTPIRSSNSQGKPLPPSLTSSDKSSGISQTLVSNFCCPS